MNGLLIMEDFWEGVPRSKKALLEKKMSNWAKMTLDELLKDLHCQNSKKFHGKMSGIQIFKYRESAKCRIIYTYARELNHPDIGEDDLDNIVFLYYGSDHDKQDFLVKRRVSWIRPVKKYGQAEDDVVYPPYLSSLQRDCLKSDFPMLIFAGAGSGKTTIAVRRMQMEMGEANEEDRSVYIAISDRLIAKAKKEYKSNEGKSSGGKSEFFTLEDLCKSLLGISEDAITFDEFNRDFYIPKVKSSLTSLALWTEIRGVIKGYMGNTWRRTLSVKQDRFDSDFVRFIDNHNLWERGNDAQQAVLFLPCSMSVNDWYNRVKKIIGIDSCFEKSIREAREYFENVGNWKDEITMEEYIDLNNKNLDTMATSYSQSERKEIYRLYEKYKNWLKENDRLDDNDLAKKVLAAGIKDRFSLIIIDEAQDFTQLQMLMLFALAKPYRYQIARDVEKTVYKMIIAGDVHQTIHPTYFSLEQLRQLFFIHTGRKADVSLLPESHRSYSEVLKATTALSSIRRDRIGRLDGSTEDIPSAIRDGGKAFSLKNDISYLQSIVSCLDRVPDHVVIVPNEVEKMRLKSSLNIDREHVNIFTVEEMKGLELKFVICFNILSAYEDVWREIMTQTVKKKAQYRFYFNLLYVAVTRAVMYACIYEEKHNNSDIRSITQLFDNVEKEYFYEKILPDISTDNIEDWLVSARKFENAEKYEEAVYNYRKAGLNENSHEILRCRALMEEKKGNYTKATEYYCKIGDTKDFNGFESAYKASKKSGDKILETYVSLLLKSNLTEAAERIPKEQILSAIRVYGGENGKAHDKLQDILSFSLVEVSDKFRKAMEKLEELED